MTKVDTLARPVAPVLSLPGRRAARTLSLPGRPATVPQFVPDILPGFADSGLPPEVAQLVDQAQRAMAGALALLQSGVTVRAIRLATGRTCRAATLMKRADRAAGQVEGVSE